MKKRLIFKELHNHLQHKNALVITGMRQVGKSTLMKQLFAEVKEAKLWFDFENPLDTLIFENIDYNAIYNNLRKEVRSKEGRLFVFIDEIQNFPEITKIIKYHIDKFNVKYVVTGSSNYYLKNLFPESLSGRKFLFQLSPLSFYEYLYFLDKEDELQPFTSQINFSALHRKRLLEFKRYEPEYNDYLEYGGFPEVVCTFDKETKKMVLKNIFTSFFEKDIKILSDFKDIKELRDLILLLAPRVGSKLDVSKLSSELGVNRVKLYSYLEFLQGVFFLKLIPRYSSSIDRSVAGGKKVYFSDNGLLKIMTTLNEGQLFENAVANQLSFYGELMYYDKRNRAELDFILNRKIAFEVKVKAGKNDFKKLLTLSSELGISDVHMISKNYIEDDQVIFPMFI